MDAQQSRLHQTNLHRIKPSHAYHHIVISLLRALSFVLFLAHCYSLQLIAISFCLFMCTLCNRMYHTCTLFFLSSPSPFFSLVSCITTLCFLSFSPLFVVHGDDDEMRQEQIKRKGKVKVSFKEKEKVKVRVSFKGKVKGKGRRRSCGFPLSRKKRERCDKARVHVAW